MSKRITNKDREAIISNCEEILFGNRVEKIINTEKKIAMSLVNISLTDDFKKVSADNPTWFRKATRLYLYNNNSIVFSFIFSEENFFRAPFNMFTSSYENRIKILSESIDKKILDEIILLEKEKNKLDSDNQKLKEDLKGFLYGINTLKRLKEEWPEGEKYYDFLDNKSGCFPITIVSSSVNKTIQGLEMVA